MWLIFSLLTLLFWGVSQFFYKLSNNFSEKFSSIKTVVMVGLFFGFYIFVYYFLIKGFHFNFSFDDALSSNEYSIMRLVEYLPISIAYISSMWLSYIGLRYLEVSVASPIANASGGFSALLIIVFSRVEINPFVVVSILFITLGTIFLGAKKDKDDKEILNSKEQKNSKYYIGWVAIIFPVLYMVLDSIGTFLDGIVLDEKKLVIFNKTIRFSFTENEAQISYMLTFFIVALLLVVYLFAIKKVKLNFSLEKFRIFGAGFELLGQITYIFALARNAVFSAPIIAAFSIVSIVLGRIFLKEKLSKFSYLSISMIIIGTIILGIFDF